ncbi:dynamin family protein [Cytobacillus massiliigabonensis]|uniref:dynamin family protein n=1 Tax=Cytobacillus massiliigabonensis TaxID=1871011 RepID=UPI000C8528FB|nr:dynamin family protein [Cytobacillus massiliigabonensis]
MVQKVLHLDAAELMSKITALNEYFYTNGDKKTAERAKDLALKLDKQEYSIAFCGHFSAGKSSMINQIIGENLLPSSPIPTSANLVKIKSGDSYAKVIFKEGKSRIYPAPYDYEQVKSYCKDGDQIHSIEISYANTSLPNDAVIMDTPGIDSTDDAHRIATESALHLADLVFYVMDYNHVQSELNFLFTKELTAAGKQVYLIINQIDKHRDDELSFEEFKASVRDSFASWGVEPAKIFYTSLKSLSHEENEFSALQLFIEEMIANRKSLLPESVLQSLTKLTEEHQIFLEEKQWEERDKYEAILAEFSADERKLLPEKLEAVTNELDEMTAIVSTAENRLNNKVDEVLKNAYLMPFQTRELAEAYVESRQSSFKVGLFFSKQKTEQERESRLKQFHKELSENVQSQLDWHLKELYLHEMKQFDIHEPELLEKAQSFQIDVPESLINQAVKDGAMLSGDYVLHYTNDVAELVKKLAKENLLPLKALFLDELRSKQEQGKRKLEKEFEQLKVYANAWEQLIGLKEIQAQSKKQISDFLAGEFPKEQMKDKTEQLLSSETEEAEIVYQIEESVADTGNGEKVIKDEIDVLKKDKKGLEQSDVHSLIEKLNFTANKVQTVPGFKKMAEELLQKAERLQNKQFTVALFGAFSAGKSSFANALIGKKVLPVSPNPTTAAINKIMPINEQFGHGTVLVKIKESHILFDDVCRSLKFFDLTANDFDDALKKIAKVMNGKTDFEANEKTHFAFLHAFLRGFEVFRQALGTIVETDLDQLKDYVAIEEKSCFVEMIEVYYDCALTRQGITLVDTPGADSINARHTGVAFDYIKNSDAILFVTYYNHAFSKADREFLIQLGRVKDSFELDKMFFIVNAIDLANNEEEKDSVLEYVRDQLVQYGIRRPNLFGLSSLLALSEKLHQKEAAESKLNLFEESFYSFITNELMEISVTSAEMEWQRVLDQLRNFIQSSQEDKESKIQRRNHLENEQKTIENMIRNQDAAFFTQRLNQEADELVYYIRQRVFLRFNDFVKEAFNPALLKEDGRNLKKALQMALADFLQTFGFDFAQELRATTVRMEVYIGKLLKEAQKKLIASAGEINSELKFSPFEGKKLVGIDFETAFQNEDPAQFKKALAYFKNPKSFFEKNERKILSEELEQNMQEPSAAYLKQESIRLKDYYQAMLKEEFARFLAVHMEQADEYYNGLLAVLRDDFPIDQLKAMEKDIAGKG